jgi:Rap1a immunity proteins
MIRQLQGGLPMTKSSSALLLSAVLALTVTAAKAEDATSANYLMPGCRGMLTQSSNATDPTKVGYCAGIVLGIASMGGLASFAWRAEGKVPLDRKAPLALLCMDLPGGVTAGQEIRVVVAYIDARPARMHEDFRGLAIEALRAAWPCK